MHTGHAITESIYMQIFRTQLALLGLALSPLTLATPSDAPSLCEAQAEMILSRLQSEVVGELAADERTAANSIVLEVCRDREQAAEIEMEQAVMQAREEEQEKADSWLTESADKPGNARLKRKSH